MNWLNAHRRVALGAAVALLLVVVTLDVWLLVLRQDRQSEEEARKDALASATEHVPVVLSYDYRTLESDLEEAREVLTGDFKEEFTTLVESAVGPAARKGRVVTTSEVATAGVVSSDPDEVVILLMVNQSTESRRNRRPQIEGNRVQATMRRSGDRWLIAGITPV